MHKIDFESKSSKLPFFSGSQSAMLLVYVFLHCIATAAIRAAQVGLIPYASLAMFNPAGTLTRATCGECVCVMFYSTGNASVLSLNCHANTPNSVTCDMFTLGTYLSSPNLGMVSNSSNRFYFVQLPPSVEVQTTAVTTGLYFPCMCHRSTVLIQEVRIRVARNDEQRLLKSK